MYDAFIFDMDGTIFRTEKILEPSLDDTFQHLRSLNLWFDETPINRYRQIMGVPLPVVWETLLPHHNRDVRDFANDFFHKRLTENINSGKGALYDGTIELFSYLTQQGCRLFIASNGQTEYLTAIADFYQLHRWITAVYSIQTIASQDKSELVEAIVKMHNIRDGVVVGDRLSDFTAAKSNGLYSVGCRFYFAKADELSKADMVIDNFAELIDQLSTQKSLLKTHSKN